MMASLSSSPARGHPGGESVSRTICLGLLMMTLSTFAACGEGRWGAEITLTLTTTDASDVTVGPEHMLSLPSGHRVIPTRACLGMDTAVISPVTPEGSDQEPGDTCFCHGDPPHCHGDCSPTTAGAMPPIIRTLQVGLDLLGGASVVVTSGAAPGEYDVVTLSLGPPAPDALPPACAGLAESAFFLEGDLLEPGASEGRRLTIDLRVYDRITEALWAENPAMATGEMALRLRLDLVLDAVDWSRVQPDPDGGVTIGGSSSTNIIAVGELISGLTSASSWVAGPQMSP